VTCDLHTKAPPYPGDSVFEIMVFKGNRLTGLFVEKMMVMVVR
jgi:hypothetical protein